MCSFSGGLFYYYDIFCCIEYIYKYIRRLLVQERGALLSLIALKGTAELAIGIVPILCLTLPIKTLHGAQSLRS